MSADDWLTVLHGDCRDVLATLPDESVHCVVTSPPYWGLRDYGTGTWSGGDDAHQHVGVNLRTADVGGPKQQTKRGSIGVRSGDCACGAVRTDNQIGLEPTPEEYVATMVGVFREVRRVLRRDGTLWLNLGDSYATSPKGNPGDGMNGRRFGASEHSYDKRNIPGLKPKDLVGIPWRVAFALQADGWYLRSDIIWSKPNPMPESVTDRPTKSHEYLFLLTRSERYHYDADAIREDNAREWDESNIGPRNRINTGVLVGRVLGRETNPHGGLAATLPNAAGRNRRSVWTIATQPYPGAHFATFPPKLVEPCILAGCPENGVVLDPFAGTGTVGMVAQKLSRRAVLIDLNGDYLDQLRGRNSQVPLGLASGVA